MSWRSCYACVHYKPGWGSSKCYPCIPDPARPNWTQIPHKSTTFNPHGDQRVRRGDYYSHKDAIEEAKNS